jgi:hypothetical protein
VNTQTDNANCGGCGMQCGYNQVCAAGRCENYRPGLSCTTGTGATCANCNTAYGAGNYVVCPGLGTQKASICVAGTACP